MVRHASLFSQLVAFFHRSEFRNLVFRHKAERYTKGFNSWDQFVAMLFCQFAQAKSLPEICGGLSCCLGKLRHLGVKKAPNKSTVSHGKIFDRDKTTALKPGDMAIMAPGDPMYGYIEVETVIQLHGTGPWGIEYINPEDDPCE